MDPYLYRGLSIVELLLCFFPNCCPLLGQQDDVVDVVGSLKVVLLASLLWILCPDTCVNVSLSIAGCMLLVMTPNVVAPVVISSKRDIPVANITRFLFGVSVHCILTFFGGGWNVTDW